MLPHMSHKLVFGHRGSPHTATENTLAALQAALDEGADGVEFDVQTTRDGVFVLFHDTVFAGKPVHQYRFHELEDAMGHPMSTLPEVLARLPASAHLYCEFKRQGSLVELDAAERLTDLLRARPRAMLASFDAFFLKLAALAAPEVPRALILDGRMLSDPAAFVAPAWVGTVSMSLDLVDTPVLAACEGRATLAWPVDTDADLRRCLATDGLGGVVTKRPDVAARMARALPHGAGGA